MRLSRAWLSLKKKWGLGALAFWSRAGISVGRADYDDGYRDATLYCASLEVGKRLDERWNLWAKFSFDRRRAAPAESGNLRRVERCVQPARTQFQNRGSIFIE